MSDMHRPTHIKRLQQQRFDVLVIGGGASGAGIALDAVTRGLSVALVERGDFASGASSHSTKLVHGGVRYLEAAITHLDRNQFHLVREALAERAHLLHIAPHLVHPLRTVVPAYSWRELAIYRTGLWLYDRAAGRAAIQPSHRLTRAALLRAFPNLKPHRLKGGVAYYDGQFDDARMVMALLTTATAYGATVANYTKVTRLIRAHGRITGAQVVDRLGDGDFDIHAQVVINATGAGSDAIRRMANPAADPIMAPSRGSHISLDAHWTPTNEGLLIPKTRDGRVLFMLPWLDSTLVGTTDIASAPQDAPKPTDEEITYLLEQLSHWLTPAPTRAEIQASWAGLRPLVADHATSSAATNREHHIEASAQGLVTIAGGKWTTYRRMAEQTLDTAIRAANLAPRQSCTSTQQLLNGAQGYDKDYANELVSQYAIAPDVAQHLAHSYGTRAAFILSQCKSHRRLLENRPYLEAEIAYICQHEMAVTADDIIDRRLRLGLEHQQEAAAAVQKIKALMSMS